MEWADVELANGLFVKLVNPVTSTSAGGGDPKGSAAPAPSGRRMSTAGTPVGAGSLPVDWLDRCPESQAFCLLRVSLDAPNLVVVYLAFFATPPPLRREVQASFQDAVTKAGLRKPPAASQRSDKSALRPGPLGGRAGLAVSLSGDGNASESADQSSRFQFLDVFLSRLLLRNSDGSDGGGVVEDVDTPGLSAEHCCGGTRVPRSMLLTMWRRR